MFVLSPLRGSEGREPGGPSLHTAPWSPQKTRVRRPAGETGGSAPPQPTLLAPRAQQSPGVPAYTLSRGLRRRPGYEGLQGRREGQPLPSPPCWLPEHSRALGSQRSERTAGTWRGCTGRPSGNLLTPQGCEAALLSIKEMEILALITDQGSPQGTDFIQGLSSESCMMLELVQWAPGAMAEGGDRCCGEGGGWGQL